MCSAWSKSPCRSGASKSRLLSGLYVYRFIVGVGGGGHVEGPAHVLDDDVPVSESTVNLKCPVAVHPETRVAQQVILETDRYEMRHLLSQFGPREGAPC